MPTNYFIKSSVFLILLFYAMLYGACLKKSNTTNETKQKFPPSNTDMPNKGDNHVLAGTKPLSSLLEDTIPNNEPSLYSQAISPVANNKEDSVREAENSHFIAPESASSAPQDVALTQEMLTPVNKELTDLSHRRIPIGIDRVDFYTKDLLTLLGLSENGWLTDNVIMAYMKMIENRSKRDNKLPKVYVYDTVSYSALFRKEYSKVQSWIKDGLSSYDRALMPIHLKDHWCLAVIDLRKNSKGVNTIRCIEYYDSLGGKDATCQKTILDYLRHEIKDYEVNDKEVVFEFEFKYKYQKDTKIQHDGSACGVFICKFADYAARGAKIDFKQENIPYFRKRMAIEILKGDFI